MVPEAPPLKKEMKETRLSLSVRLFQNIHNGEMIMGYVDETGVEGSELHIKNPAIITPIEKQALTIFNMVPLINQAFVGGKSYDINLAGLRPIFAEAPLGLRMHYLEKFHSDRLKEFNEQSETNTSVTKLIVEKKEETKQLEIPNNL